MSNYDPTLEQFIKFVPSCQSPTSLEKILVSFQRYQSNLLVVVNEAKFPLGVISARRALYLRIDKKSSFSAIASLLSPISTISEGITLQELLPYLERSNTNEDIFVVSKSGQLRGQLDIESILEMLLREKNQPSPPSLALETTPLLEFLEKLPLPLMLQNERGEVLHQNQHWRDKICVHTENCCFLGEDAPEKVEKQWCNVISEPPETQQKSVSDTKTMNPRCPLFPLSGNPTEATTGNQSGVWQFMTLNLPEQVGKWSLILATDITEQRQLCKELAAKNADLVQLNRLKDEFLACITHELKSPLTAIVGLSNLLNEKSLGDLNQRQQRYVNQIYQSGRQLMNLVNDLLDLARLETGQLQIHPEVLNLQQVCDRAYHEAQQQTPHSSPEFTLKIESQLDRMIADELRLRQMLVHLLSNARKFTAQEGKMGLDVTQWEGWIAFTVWDTGIGIPEALQHLIFQKFQQLEDPMTRQFSGTGLGLVLTQRLAHAHGGDVSFISEEGKGSQFTLLLPPTPPSKTFTPPTHSHQNVGKLVLVVEAVPKYLSDLTQQLQELGYRVAIARSGTEALLKARTFQPRTILINPVLPLLSGWDVLTLIKSHPSSCQIPVIVTATRGEKQEALNNGADAFLSLPIENNSLQDALAACAAPRSMYRKAITVLRLHYANTPSFNPSDSVSETLNLPPQNYTKNINYRILEADDPEQAELLQRIWHPDVLLLTGENIPSSFIEKISQQDSLPSLPVVCLSAETAQLAHEVGKLSVYPCLNCDRQGKNSLWSVLQFAAGMNPPARDTAPYIVIVDGRKLNTHSSPSSVEHSYHSGSQWLNAFIQYLATAGYRSSFSHSWRQIYQQVQHQGADILLLDLQNIEVSDEITEGLQQLNTIKNLPVIALVSSHQLEQHHPLSDLIQQVATQILSGYPSSMQELVNTLEEQL